MSAKINKVTNYVMILNLSYEYSQRQHTPKPAAQVPFAFPPLPAHSEAV